ncbi:MAG: sigma-70 family RNA polymerase sigma factor [Capsulimonadales bacterium]|nr:sigma-70 family RNA polymerase sigma factor [Capsulimonadales bacterium]
MRRAQRGETGARDLLVRSFREMAIGYATSILGDAQRAEDVAQEALIEAMLRIASLEVPEAFPSLLKALIRKHCDRLTRRRALPTSPFNEAFAVPSTAGASGDPMARMQEEARREIIREAVRRLPSTQKNVVLLYYVGGQSLQQIADTLSLPVSTVKSRLHEARIYLKRKIRKDGGGE